MIFLRWVALGALLLSGLAEWAASHPPCLLCWLQRILWGILFLCSLRRGMARAVFQALLLLNALIAFYQTLIAFDKVKDRCLTARAPRSLTEFKKNMETPPTRGCKPEWNIFSLPAPLWNALGCTVLFVAISIPRAAQNGRENRLY